MKRNLGLLLCILTFSLCFSIALGEPTPTPTPKAKTTRVHRRSRAKARAVAAADAAKSTKTTKKKTDDVPDIDSKSSESKSSESKSSDAKGSAASSAKASQVIVQATKATLRAKPSKTARSLGVLTTFTPVEVVESAGAWKKVKTGDDVTGYVDAGTLGRSAYVSTLGAAVKVRSGPNADDIALFSLKEHYPLRVVEKQGIRVRVVDSEGDGGWVSEKMLSTRNYVVAKEKTITLREGAGKQFTKRFVADKGALFEVVEEKAGWLHLKYSDGDEGWASAKVVWGYLPQ